MKTFGNFLLDNGEYSSVLPADVKKVRGIYLTDGVALLDVSKEKKMYRKADNWCKEHGGVIPTAKILYFILFNLDAINELREKIGQAPISKKFVVWSSESLQLKKSSIKFNYALNLDSARIEPKVSSTILLDDHDIANVICVSAD